MTDESETADEFEDLASITEGGFLFLLGTVVQYAAGFGTNLLLTNAFGAAGYGIYAYGKRIFSILSTLVTSGPNTTLLRYVPKHVDDKVQRNEILGITYALLATIAFVLLVALFVLAPEISRRTLDKPVFVRVLQLFSIILFVDIFTETISQSFKSIEIISIDILLRKVLRPLSILATVAVGVIIGLTVVDLVASLIIAYAIVLIIAVVLLATRTDLIPKPSVDRGKVVEIVTYSGTVSGSRLGTFLYTRVDLLMVGILLTSADVGIYNIALLVTGLLRFPLSAINQLFPPIASRLYENNRRATLSNIYQVVSRWNLTLTLFPVVWMVLFRRDLMALFGDPFIRGTSVLLLFAVAQLIASSVGPTGSLLLMTDNQRIAFINRWIFGVTNVGLNYLAILEFGLIGAAAVTAGVLAALNLVRLTEVWYFENLSPYSWSLLKPVIAMAPSTAVMMTSQSLLPGIQGAGFSGLLGIGTYFFTLIALGIEDPDKDIISALVPQLND